MYSQDEWSAHRVTAFLHLTIALTGKRIYLVYGATSPNILRLSAVIAGATCDTDIQPYGILSCDGVLNRFKLTGRLYYSP